jgi:hypothetical protein
MQRCPPSDEKLVFDFGQREVIFFLYTLVTNKGEHSIIYFFIRMQRCPPSDEKLVYVYYSAS